MKKTTLILTVIVLVFLASCATPKAAGQGDWLGNAAEYVKTLYDKSTLDNPAPKTGADFQVLDQITIKGNIYSVAWSTDTDSVKVVPQENHVVLIDIDDESPEEIVYTLKAVITDADGKSATVEMKKTLPLVEKNLSPSQIVENAYQLVDGEYLPKEVTLTGVVVKIDTAYSDQYKNITVTIQIGNLADKPIQCFRLSGEGCEAIKEGDLITVSGKVKNYKGTFEFDKPVLDARVDLSGQGAILEKAFALAESAAMDDVVTVVGTIVEIPTVYSEKYDNITVNIQPNGDERILQCFRLKGGAELAVGDLIIVTGKIKNYKGTIEFDAGCTYTK